jgi:hypothetical protein
VHLGTDPRGGAEAPAGQGREFGFTAFGPRRFSKIDTNEIGMFPRILKDSTGRIRRRATSPKRRRSSEPSGAAQLATRPATSAGGMPESPVAPYKAISSAGYNAPGTTPASPSACRAATTASCASRFISRSDLLPGK